MEENLRLQMLEMMLGGILSQALAVVAELGIADSLIEGPKTAAELAANANVQPVKLHRLLRYTASYGVFRDTGNGRFELTPLGSLLRTDSQQSVRAAGRMIQRASRAYPFMLENVRTGKCAYDQAFGKSIFEDLGDHPQEAAIFDAAMTSFHGGETEAVLNAYPLTGVTTICDVGCGSGAMMAVTLSRYPSINAILFDLARVMERTRTNIADAGVAARCRFETGSFFDTIPSGADVYTMRHIIHDWQDAECLRILGHIRAAMKPDARLLIMEAVIPGGNDRSLSKLFDMAMMLWPNGVERSADEYSILLQQANFDLKSITPTQSAVSVIEARPRQ